MDKCSLESLVQAVVARKNLNVYQAGQWLGKLLYANFKATVSQTEWALAEKLFRESNLGSLKPSDAGRMLQLIETHYKSCTALLLAETLADAISMNFAPISVLSFNAEQLLLALTNSCLRVKHNVPNAKLFDVSVRGISSRRQGRISFNFCHGLLPLPGMKASVGSGSLDKLVFSEAEYLGVAAASFSWQSTVFLEAALRSTMVFVGLSFTDPNLRRWLGFVHANRMGELQQVKSGSDGSSHHYWIEHRPPTRAEESWIEASVAHLGVRLVWIDSWSDVDAVLRKMLAL